MRGMHKAALADMEIMVEAGNLGRKSHVYSHFQSTIMHKVEKYDLLLKPNHIHTFMFW
jgi:hypothetical protein